jgi:transcription termination/antitermination protein NusG
MKKDTFDVQGLYSQNVTPMWYIIQVYVGFEDAVRKNFDLKLANVPELKEKIKEIFIPTSKIIKINKKGEKIEKQIKIYPGYIYINCTLDKEIGYIIQNTPYVSKIAGTGDYAVPLEDGYIENLKLKLIADDMEPVKTDFKDYKNGDDVMIVDGPFKDMKGVICGFDTANSRVSVLLTIFERESTVDIDISEVKKIN